MMKRAFMALTLCLAATLAQAVPAKQGLWKTITLADGQQIKAELTGDEFFHYWRTADGNAYTYDNESQRYVSVNLNERAKTANAARQTRQRLLPRQFIQARKEAGLYSWSSRERKTAP